MIKQFFAVLGMLLLAGSVQAAEIVVAGHSAPTITIKGYINDEDAARFAKIADANPWAAVVLESAGGRVIPAIEIGRKVRAMKAVTFVGAKQMCASACGLIWLAGRERFIYNSSRVGFHATYTATGTSLDVSAAGNALVGGYLRDLGYSDAVLVYASMAPPKGMQWLTAEDADRLGITYKSLRDRDTQSGDKAAFGQEFYAPARFTYLNGYMLVGNSIGRPLRNKQRIEDCIMQCGQTLDCVAINFDITERACHLKTEALLAVKNKRYKAGFRSDMDVKVSDPLAYTRDPSLNFE